MNPEFLDVDDLKRMPWQAATVASSRARGRNASRGIPARSNGLSSFYSSRLRLPRAGI